MKKVLDGPSPILGMIHRYSVALEQSRTALTDIQRVPKSLRWEGQRIEGHVRVSRTR